MEFEKDGAFCLECFEKQAAEWLDSPRYVFALFSRYPCFIGRKYDILIKESIRFRKAVPARNAENGWLIAWRKREKNRRAGESRWRNVIMELRDI